MFALIDSGQPQIFIRSFARFLDQSVQQYHPPLFVDVEKHPRNSVLAQAGPNFVDAAAQWSADRHANGSAKFHRLGILADALAILG